MANTEAELIQEVRAQTGYTTGNILDDGTMRQLVEICKEEIRVEWPLNDNLFPGYFNGDLEVDRALFWFTCLASKVRTGELAGMDISAGTLLDVAPSSTSEPYYVQMFQKRMQGISGRAGPAQSQIERTSERTYGDN